MVRAPRHIGRREFVKGLGFGALTLGAGGALAACGSGSAAPSAATASQKPKRGGTLVAGISGGSSTDALDPLGVFTNGDFARDLNLYESLVGYTRDAQITLVLAEEMIPNKDATLWTVRLRPGITFHNGKDLTSEDVAYTFRKILDPKAPTDGAPAIAPIDAANIKIVDPLTLQIPCTTPFSTFLTQLENYQYYIIPTDFDQAHPVGTGPFKYKSFTPGVESVFTRNENYWQPGLPYVDELVIQDYTSTTAQVNALETGQIDVMDSLPPSLISSVRSAGNRVLISNGGTAPTLYMRVDLPPFNDPNVRVAFKSLLNREEMLDIVFDGHGTIGNDIVAPWDPLRDERLLPRRYDPDYAKSLLKKAGHENLTVQWTVAEVIPGVTHIMEVYQQQAKAGGVQMNLDVVTTSEIYGSELFKWPLGVDYWVYVPYLSTAGAALISTSYYNETHFNNERYDQLYKEANATTNMALQKEIVAEMQTIDYDLGGFIIPLFSPECDVYSSRVQGGVASKVGEPFNLFDFKQLWLT